MMRRQLNASSGKPWRRRTDGLRPPSNPASSTCTLSPFTSLTKRDRTPGGNHVDGYGSCSCGCGPTPSESTESAGGLTAAATALGRAAQPATAPKPFRIVRLLGPCFTPWGSLKTTSFRVGQVQRSCTAGVLTFHVHLRTGSIRGGRARLLRVRQVQRAVRRLMYASAPARHGTTTTPAPASLPEPMLYA